MASKISASTIDRIEFRNGDVVSRCDDIWVGSIGEYTTTYDTLKEFLDDEKRRDKIIADYEKLKRILKFPPNYTEN